MYQNPSFFPLDVSFNVKEQSGSVASANVVLLPIPVFDYCSHGGVQPDWPSGGPVPLHGAHPPGHLCRKVELAEWAPTTRQPGRLPGHGTGKTR